MVAGTVLVLVGAITKSAMVPFHFWLPAAMEAPTPVSAYLHAAAMVKAGIYLVARLAPGLRRRPRAGGRSCSAWALATMLVGGYRRLRQTDLKLLLAFGTVSQLGFLMVLVGAGSRELAAAGLAMTLAHALFKSTLFLTVGVIDHATGTRDLRRLSGLGRRLPALAVIGGLAAPRWPGVPPLLGFVGKEAAFTALRDGGLADRTAAVVVLAGLVAGLGADRRLHRSVRGGARSPASPGCPTPRRPSSVHRPGPAVPRRPAVLALAGLLAGPASPLLEPLVAGYADTLPLVAPEAEQLALWHGWQPALAAVGGQPARRRGAVRRPHAGLPAAAAVRRRGLGRRGLLERDPGARPARGAGHRHHPARVAARLPRHDPRRRPGAARHGADHPRALAGRVAGLGHPGAGAGRRRRPDRRGDGAADPAAAVGGPRRRRHRLRPRRPLRPAGRARPGAHPVPRRDAHPGHVRAGAAQAAEGHHRAAPAPRARRPRGHRRRRRRC